MKTYQVRVPCVYSEVYEVEANSAEEAKEIVRNGQGTCLGESIYGDEHDGEYKVQEIKSKQSKSKT